MSNIIIESVKHSRGVTFIKQSPVLKGCLFLFIWHESLLRWHLS